MKIFVGFGYNARDKWIKDLAIPLIEAFDHEVITGEDMPGDIISQEVRRRIDRSDALIGFLSRRDAIANGKWTTHRWVVEEMALGLARAIPVIEIRESDVDAQSGVQGDRQRLEYSEASLPQLLVEIAKTVGALSRNRVMLQLTSRQDNIIHELLPLLKRPDFRCVYQIIDDGEEGQEIVAPIKKFKGGLFVEVASVSNEQLISLRIEQGSKTWTSVPIGLDGYAIELVKG